MPAYTTESPRAAGLLGHGGVLPTSVAARHRKEMQGLSSSFSELEKTCARKEHRLEEATKELAKLQREAERGDSEIRAHRNVTAALRAEKQEWETRLDASKSLIRKLEARLAVLEAAPDAHRRAQALAAEAQQLRDKVEELQIQRKETDATLMQIRAENSVLTKALAIRAEDLGLPAQNLRSGVLYDLGLAKETEAQLRAKVATLERELLHAQGEVRDLQRGLGKLQAFRREDQDGLADLEARTEALQKTRQTLLDEVSAFSEERDAMRRMVSHLRTEMLSGAEDRQAGEARELEKGRRVGALEQQIQAVEQEQGLRARRHLEQQQDQQRELEDAQFRLEEGERQKVSLQRDLEDATQKVHAMQLLGEKTKAQLHEERETASALRAELASLRREAAADAAKASAEAETSARARSDHDSAVADVRSTRQELARLEGELVSEQRARKEAERSLLGLVDDKRRMGRAAEAAVRQCQETLARAPGLEEALRERSTDLRGTPPRARSPGCDTARDSLEETLVRQLSKTSQRLDSLATSKHSAESSLTRLQRENENLRSLLSKETLAHHRRVDRDD